jgi:hypothetical protein
LLLPALPDRSEPGFGHYYWLKAIPCGLLTLRRQPRLGRERKSHNLTLPMVQLLRQRFKIVTL